MKNQSGQSLIQVLVSVAIMAVVLTAMSTMFNNLNRETRAMSEKLAALDLEKVLIASLADGSACLYSLSNPLPLTFDASAPMSATTPKLITLPSTPSNPARLYSSYDPSGPTLGPVVAQVGQAAAPYANSVVVSAINLELTSISGPTINGRWRIDFDNSKLVRPLKSAYVSVTLKADITSPASAKFTSCQGTSVAPTSSGGSGDWCGAFMGSPDGVTGSAYYIYHVNMKCHGKDPACPAGMVEKGPGICLAAPFVYGYDTNSVCPSGYRIRQVTPLIGDASGLGENLSLFTCTPN